MFTIADIKKRTKGVPFQPFRLIASIGNSYDITHPDLIWPAANFVMVGTPSEKDESIPEGPVRIALIHISEIVDLPRRAPASSNGSPPR